MASIELLSPAGNWNSLKAAVEEGADAVYFGVERFNARRRAENFSEKEVEEIAEYCHNRGVRAYITLNTLVKNNEIADYFKLIERAYFAGIDAVIIQDIAFIDIIKNSLPDFEVHLSTQAGIFNSYYLPLIEKADRVILPRELSLNQIKEFHKKTNKEVEVFIQGALCFSISGQCLMSSFLGGRSGNRGLCAQPCRKRYNNRYMLSTRDLCLIEKLPEIAKAGIRSLKIEGRLRSPEYVGAATALYRRALDSLEKGSFEIDKNALFDLELSFSREYTQGGMFKVDDVVTPMEGGKRGILLGKIGKGDFIRLKAPIKVGDGVGITTGNSSHGDVIRQIELNGRKVDSAECGDNVKLFINAKEDSVITITSGKARRGRYQIAKKKKIAISRKQGFSMDIPKAIEKRLEGMRILVKAYSLKEAESALNAGADEVYYNIFAKDYPIEKKGIMPYIPRCLSEWNATQAIAKVEAIKAKSVLCGDLGAAAQIKDCKIYLDISCNAFNDIDVGYYNSLGMTPVISPELSLEELKELKDKRFVVYSHGRIPLMTTKYKLEENNLSDEKGYVFPVRSELDYKQVLNSVPLGFYNEILKLRQQGITGYLLDIEENAHDITCIYKKILAGERIKKLEKEHTLGHFKKGVA